MSPEKRLKTQFQFTLCSFTRPKIAVNKTTLYMPTPGIQKAGEVYKSSGAASRTVCAATAKSLRRVCHQGYIEGFSAGGGGGGGI